MIFKISMEFTERPKDFESYQINNPTAALSMPTQKFKFIKDIKKNRKIDSEIRKQHLTSRFSASIREYEILSDRKAYISSEISDDEKYGENEEISSFRFCRQDDEPKIITRDKNTHGICKIITASEYHSIDRCDSCESNKDMENYSNSLDKIVENEENSIKFVD